jgi:hypothetical protein
MQVSMDPLEDIVPLDSYTEAAARLSRMSRIAVDLQKVLGYKAYMRGSKGTETEVTATL